MGKMDELYDWEEERWAAYAEDRTRQQRLDNEHRATDAQRRHERVRQELQEEARAKVDFKAWEAEQREWWATMPRRYEEGENG